MSWQEFTLTVIKLWRGRLHHKIAVLLIGAGATILAGSTVAMVAAAYIQYRWGITVTQTPLWSGILLIGAGQWIVWPEINKARRHPRHAHDEALLARFRNLIDAPARAFLRDRDFFAPMPRHPLGQLEILNDEWQGALFEFREATLHAAFMNFYRAVDAFLADFQYSASWMNNNPNFFTVRTAMDARYGITPETNAKVARLRQLAAAADVKLNDFERRALDRIG